MAWFNLMLVYGEDGWWEVRRHTRDNREPNGWGFYESDPSKIVDELRLDWYRELCDPARVSEAHDFIEGLNRKAEVSLLVRQIEEEDERRLRSTN